MFIELRGVEFVNKGAELMLYAIIKQVKNEFPHAKLVMERKGNSPIRKHRELKIYTKFKFRKYESLIKSINAITPALILNLFSFAKEAQVNIIIDGSGFAFGDKWGADKAGRRLANHLETWKKNGKKVILLPQAFGPFSDEILKKKMVEILSGVDLIYARDPISYNYLSAFGVGNEKVKMKPDFTNLVDGVVPEYYDKKVHQVAIIPNHKMVEATNDEVGKAYPHFLLDVITKVHELGFSPFFLIHEGERDFRLAESVNSRLNKSIPIMKEDNPLKVKGLIKVSTAVITSRYHGLVSALSQAVPCLATGWSHKYEMLLQDYSYPEGLCSVTDRSLLQKQLNRVLEVNSSNDLQKKLAIEAIKQKKESIEMWNEIFEAINS